MTIDKKHRGARSELIACAWLLHQGYEVFRNVSPHGDVDLVVIKDGNITLFDVKTGYRRPDGSALGLRKIRASQVARGVKIIHVFDDDDCWIECDPISSDNVELRKCAQCGAMFRPQLPKQIFCSNPCRVAKHLSGRKSR